MTRAPSAAARRREALIRRSSGEIPADASVTTVVISAGLIGRLTSTVIKIALIGRSFR